MQILMVAAELGPHLRSTPTADAVASLSKALRLLGHDVLIAVPRNPAFEAAGLLVARRLTPLPLPGGGEAIVLDAQLGSGAQLALLDIPGVLDGSAVLGESGDGRDAERVGGFARAVAALVRDRGKKSPIDVVHVHDWSTALVPIALRAAPGAMPPCVLTIHDVTKQGDFALDDLEAMGVPTDLRGEDGVVLGERANLLKGAVLHADAVTTPSPTYAIEVRTRQRAGALAETMLSRVDDIAGIPYGVDYATCNPATDSALFGRYDAEDPANKGSCKTALCRELGLDIETGWPVVAAIGALTEERGMDVVADALPLLLEDNATIVVAGAGSGPIAERLSALASKHPTRFALAVAPDDAKLRRIYAAADLALLCPRHEPCGTAQLFAQRYGALPVAHATGGLRDTIVDCDSSLATGTGFLFDAATRDGLVGAVRRALAAYGSTAWPALRRRVMRLDVGWDRPARRFAQVYKAAIAG